jgi:Rieske Fe-S protein
MSSSNKDRLSRRDFIKAASAWIGGLIGAVIAIPSTAYLFSPALVPGAKDDAVIDLGLLENYPLGLPTRYDFTRTRVNGWERTAMNYGLYIVRTSVLDVRVLSDICTHLGCRVTRTQILKTMSALLTALHKLGMSSRPPSAAR